MFANENSVALLGELSHPGLILLLAKDLLAIGVVVGVGVVEVDPALQLSLVVAVVESVLLDVVLLVVVERFLAVLGDGRVMHLVLIPQLQTSAGRTRAVGAGLGLDLRPLVYLFLTGTFFGVRGARGHVELEDGLDGLLEAGWGWLLLGLLLVMVGWDALGVLLATGSSFGLIPSSGLLLQPGLSLRLGSGMSLGLGNGVSLGFSMKLC